MESDKFIDFEGSWKLGDYFEEKSNGERIFYSNRLDYEENYFPDEIKGELKFKDDSYSINYRLLFKRDNNLFDTIEYSDSGVFREFVSCGSLRCMGYVDFENDNSINRDLVLQTVWSNLDSTLLMRTTIGTDSLTMYWRKGIF